MQESKFKRAIVLIDEYNQKDPNQVTVDGNIYPKELLYSQRMTTTLLGFETNPSEALQIAARAQHICRWQIPRKDYPMTRVGYLKWRETLKKMHAELTADILNTVGYEKEFIKRVSFLINKKQIKKDEESQTLEDVICLVFLEYYLGDFAVKHDDDKVIDILRKTWKKMSKKGHEAALNIKYSDKELKLVKAALESQ
ncbi:DUF4202 domain-containing protein [Changchengzhania lutea]|uniref:DUF4202 domain-containing protein n=1 Tax=Changchengzhania lutea TaxID=2049305 RepID=UPI00115ED875|nr:DUF4202 domain-containing protein [Changchengzhania lutea]